MLRVIYVNIGNHTLIVYTYTLMLLLALLISIILLPRTFKKVDLNLGSSILSMILIMASALFFARLLYFLLYPQQLTYFMQIFEFKTKNFTLYGGILGALLGAFITSKWWHFSLLRWMDYTIPIISVSLLLSRLGCLLNGCCFGKITKMPWGISMKKDSLAYYAYIQEHPLSLFSRLPKIHFTQLYEIIVVLISLSVGLILLKKEKYHGIDGYAAIAFGITLTIGRFIVFFFRSFPYASSMSNYMRGPLTYGVALAMQIMLLRKISGNKKYPDY